MPVSTDNIRRWIEQSDIDYISQYIKAWIPFNAWYNAEFSSMDSDREKINHIKNNSNVIRNKINSLLEGSGQESQEFKSYLASLHNALQDIQIDSRDGRVWFRDIVKSKNVIDLIDNETKNRITYYLKRTDGRRLMDIENMEIYMKKSNGTTFFSYAHSEYDLNHLYADSGFNALSAQQQENLRLFFEELTPITITDAIEFDLQHTPLNHYECDSIHFKRDNTDPHCPAHIMCKCLVEVLYQLRNVLFHGELSPIEQNQVVYKNAYFCLKCLLNSLR